MQYNHETRRIERRASAGFGPLLLVLLALCSLGVANAASAQAVVGPGSMPELRALIGWEGGEELLLLSPLVRHGGVFVIALPEDARLLPLSTEAPRWLGITGDSKTEPAAALKPGPDSLPPGSLAPSPGPGPVAARQKEPGGPRPLLGPLHPSLPPTHFSLRPASSLWLLDRDQADAKLESLGVSKSQRQSLRRDPDARRWLIAKAHTDPDGVWLFPIGLRFASTWPRLPARPARPDSHYRLGLRLWAAGTARDLGGADQAWGLKPVSEKQETPLPQGLRALFKKELLLKRPDFRLSRFVVPSLRPAVTTQGRFADLRLPPPPGSHLAPRVRRKTQAAREASKEGPSNSDPAGLPSCGSCTDASGQPGFAFLLLALAGLAPSRRRRAAATVGMPLGSRDRDV